MASHVFCKALVYLLLVWKSCGFNVYTKPHIYSKPGPKGGQSFFGYAVTLHSNGNEKSVLVGAPVDNVTNPFSVNQLVKFGAVYKCKYNAQNTPNDCTVVPIDDSPDRQEQDFINNVLVDVEEKSGQWLGGTLQSTGKDGKVVVCASRYIYRGLPQAGSNLQFRWVLGRCFRLSSDLTRSSNPIDPCRNRIKGNNFYGYCQAGFSAQYTSDGDVVVMGAVGITRWKGGVITTLKQSPADTAFSTQDQIGIGDYMGYAVSYGHFSAINRTEYIGGAPRGDSNMGKEGFLWQDFCPGLAGSELVTSYARTELRVLIYDYSGGEELQVTSPLPQPKNLKFGSYFGSVLCAVDLNNDKYTDVLVGAPQYTDIQDEGRVFVYINNRKGAVDYVESMILVGDRTKGARFGSTIASVGDLNKDGFLDVAVGAPYDGPDRHGAVFIYHGTQDGIENTYRQRILASEVSKELSQPVMMFGHSIAGGLDVDDNKYDDIAVGAFGSDNAFLFRTRRIIDLDSRLTLSNDQIVLENNNTLCRDATDNLLRKCINITVEFKYEDKDALNREDLNVSYQIILDLEQGVISDQFRRMFFIIGGQKSFSLSRTCILKKQSEWGCKFEQTVYLSDKNRIVDKLSSLTFRNQFDIVHDTCKLCPILNDYKPKLITKEATFLKECAGKVCRPNLELKSDFKFKEGYRELRIGAVEELTVEVIVTNLATDASYRSRVFITYPSDIGYIGPGLDDQGVQCNNQPPSNGTGMVTCEVGNPLKGKASRTFGIRYSTQNVKRDRGVMIIDVKAESANKDIDESNNKQELKIPVKVEADLAITGAIDRKEIVYSGVSTVQDILPRTQKEIGPQVVQTLTAQSQITNNGPSAVDTFNVEVFIPLRLTAHEKSYLLYLLQIELGISGSCTGKGNTLNIAKENRTQTAVESKRKRRATSSEDFAALNCNKAEACKQFSCRLGKLEKGQRVDIRLVSRLWINTFLVENPGPLDLETTARVQLDEGSKVIQSSTENDIVTIRLRVRPESTTVKVKTPIWIFIVSALGGALLLALAALLMYRFGFFERRKMPRDISNPTEAEDVPPVIKNKAELI